MITKIVKIVDVSHTIDQSSSYDNIAVRTDILTYNDDCSYGLIMCWVSLILNVWSRYQMWAPTIEDGFHIVVRLILMDGLFL